MVKRLGRFLSRDSKLKTCRCRSVKQIFLFMNYLVLIDNLAMLYSELFSLSYGGIMDRQALLANRDGWNQEYIFFIIKKTFCSSFKSQKTF